MNATPHPDYDPPSYGGTPQQEAHAEMVQIFGSENPDKEYVLTDYDVWEKNPFFTGTPGRHPEDDTPERNEENESLFFDDTPQEKMHEFLVGCDECPF